MICPRSMVVLVLLQRSASKLDDSRIYVLVGVHLLYLSFMISCRAGISVVQL